MRASTLFFLLLLFLLLLLLFSFCLVQFAELGNEVEIRRQELTLLADRLGQSSHSQLEAQLEDTRKSLEEETKAVEEAKAAGVAAIQRSVYLYYMVLRMFFLLCDADARYVGEGEGVVSSGAFMRLSAMKCFVYTAVQRPMV